MQRFELRCCFCNEVLGAAGSRRELQAILADASVRDGGQPGLVFCGAMPQALGELPCYLKGHPQEQLDARRRLVQANLDAAKTQGFLWTSGGLSTGAEVPVAQLRDKLVDRSRRSRLINFKHSARSRRELRIVSTSLDAAWATLMKGGSLTLEHLPERPAAEPELTAAEWARRQLPSSTFDLPMVDAAGGGAGSKVFQTAYLPSEFKRRAEGLRNTGRLALTERGANCLFAVFGFLDWFVVPHTDKDRNLSPLLTVPLTLQRERRGRTYRYTLRYSDEEVRPNIALSELLRGTLALPEFDLGAPPSQFLSALARSLKHLPDKRWAVKPFLTLAALDFTRLPMWEDLNPERWDVAQSPVVNELLGSRQPTSLPPIDLSDGADSASVRGLVPKTVKSADASQLLVLADAMRGKSMAVEGPPGTGKSQTIVNLIGAALANPGEPDGSRPKTVLFVAEKRAALDVVKKWLDDLGLGEFVFVLHSARARRKDVLDELNTRLRRRSRAPELSQSKPTTTHFAGVQGLREQLNGVARDLRQTVGARRVLLQQAQGHLVRLKLEHGLPGSQQLPTYHHCLAWSDEDLASIRQLADRLTETWRAEVSPFGELVKHPWFGLVEADTSVAQCMQVVQLTERLGKALSLLEQSLDGLREVDDCVGQADVVEAGAILRALVGLADGLPDPSAAESAVHRLAREVRRTGDTGELEVMAKEATALLEQQQGLLQCFPRGVGALPGAASFNEVLAQVAELRVGHLRRDDLIGERSRRRELQRRWTGLRSELHVLLQLGLVTDGLTVGGLRSVMSALSKCAEQPPLPPSGRAIALIEDGASSRFNAARVEAQHLAERSASLRESLTALPDPDLARRHAKILEDGGPLCWLSPRWHGARSFFRQHSDTGVFDAGREWSTVLTQAAQVGDALRTLEHRHGLEPLLGPDDQAERPTWAAPRAVAAWADQVRQAGGRYITDVGSGSLQALLSFAVGEPARTEEALLSPDLAAVRDLLTVTDRSHDATPLAEVPDLLRQEVMGLKQLKTRLDAIGLAVGVKLAQIGPLFTGLNAFRQRRADFLEDFGELLQKANLHEASCALQAKAAADARQVLAVVGIAEERGLPSAMAGWICGAQSKVRVHSLVRAAEAVQDATRKVSGAVAALKDQGAQLSGGNSGPRDRRELSKQIRVALSTPEAAKGLVAYLVDAAALQAKLPGLPTWATPGFAGVHDVRALVDLVYFQTLVAEGPWAGKAARPFRAEAHRQIASQFGRADRNEIAATAGLLAEDLRRVPVTPGKSRGRVRDRTQAACIEHYGGQQRPRIGLRELLRRAGDAIQDLCPVFLMSPIAVAQYLDPQRPAGPLRFDLVIIDEASQMTPEDALCALARGRQAVVVGDTKQLPPTGFFRNAASDVEEEDDVAEVDAESILQLAIDRFHPARQGLRSLLWHYRSKHPALIDFSNHEFYDRELVLFPSPDASEAAGVGLSLQRVDGQYIRGQRVNPDEAEAVAREALRQMARHPDRSLGVVAFNLQQAELIATQIDELGQAGSVGDEFRDRWREGLRPFFVKNLENVQGDERDTILISTVFGPDGQGRFPNQFGPIGTAQGWKRLNVIFSRAVYRMIVFTSIPTHRITAPSRGAQTLRRFLEYAESGRLAQKGGPDAAWPTGGATESPFEDAVLAALHDRGIGADPQIGAGRYRIDIGIRHPSTPGRYILGVECDGATYHSCRTARDRDRLRQGILMQMGWDLHRIWSTDWFHDPAQQLNRLLEEIERRKAAVEADDARRASLFAATAKEQEEQRVVPSVPQATPRDPTSSPQARTSRQDWLDHVQAQLGAIQAEVESQEPDVSPALSLFRPAMVDALIRHAPTSKQAFRTLVSESLRSNTDGRHARAALQRIVEMFEEAEDLREA